MRRLSTGAERIRASRSVLALLVSLAAACGGDGASPTPPPPPPPPPPPAVASLVINAGDQQQAAGGAPVAIAPAVLVRNAQGGAVAGVTVQFTVLEGGGSVAGGAPTSDAAGVARVTGWTLGASGAQRLRAQVGSLPAVEFQATLTPGTETITTTIGSGGGSVQIATPGHPLQGLSLTIPNGTFSAGSAVSIRIAANVVPPAMPPGYRVTGPVLEVFTAAERGSKLMTLEVPVTRVANEDIVLALHDAVRGLTEVLPTVARGPNSITVMTAHLRADQLLGPSGAGSLGLLGGSGPSAVFPIGQSGWVMQVAFPLPQPPVLPVLDLQLHRWPVLDHGSASSPNGFGGAIPTVISASYSLNSASLVKPLDTPGFYAEAAPIATLEAVLGKLNPLFGGPGPLDQFLSAVAPLAKPDRDEMTHRNIVAGMAISAATSVVALVPTGGADPVFVNSVSGSETDLRFLSAATLTSVLFGRTAGAGYTPLSVERTPDQPPIIVDGAVPLSSAFLNMNAILPDISAMLQVLNLPEGSAQRAASNRLLAAAAGLPRLQLELEGSPGGGWWTSGAQLLLRNLRTKIRINAGSPGSFTIHLPSGLELGRAEGAPIEVGDVAGLTTLPLNTPMQHVFSAFETIGGLMRQIVPVEVPVVWTPFQVVPDEQTLSPPQLDVVFDAAVPFPPAEGYRIKWAWGDGEVTENLGLTTATHTYAQNGDYEVFVTLMANTPGREILAKDTVQVTAVGEPFWRITSFKDLDGFYDPVEDGAPQNEMEKILVNPASGLIGVIQVPGGSEMRLWAKATGVWTDTDCCPPTFSPGDQFMMLGTKPASQASLGPYFTQWREIFWLGDNLNAGSWTGRGVGPIVQYSIKDGGSQMGPDYATELVASAQEKNLTGTITLTLWYLNDDGELDEQSKSSFRFQFTALRMQ